MAALIAVQKTIPNRPGRRVGEVAGNATAECAAVCCCLPCAVMDMIALAAYKIPAGLWKKAMKNRRKRRLQKQQKKLLQQKPIGPETVIVGPTLEEQLAKEESTEADKLEKEMWARFSTTGFWRSSSQGFQREPEMQTGEKDR